MSENGDSIDNADTNNKIVPVKDNTRSMARRERKQHQAELNLAEFAKYYFARWSPELICKTLKIHRTTYYDYVRKLSGQQKQMIQSENRDYYNLEVARYQNDLNYLINKCKHTIEKNDATDDDKLMAINLMAEIGKQSLLLFTNGPIDVMRKMPFVIKKALDENKDTVGIKIEAPTAADGDNESEEESTAEIEIEIGEEEEDVEPEQEGTKE